MVHEFRDKVVKTKDIAFFYFLRYLDVTPIPVPEKAFMSALHDDGSPVWDLLEKNSTEERIFEHADRICDGEIRVYDIDSGLFRSGLSWHKDYYTGFEWPLKPFNRIYDPNDSGFDLNVPFEISRLQFVPTLLKAYRASKDMKYLSRLSQLLDSWIEENPYGFGVNWWSAMEVGLRAVNLVLAVSFLAGKLPTEKLGRYFRVLWRHGLYIYTYDVLGDKVKNKNNHFLGSMLGMLAVSMCFEGRKPSYLVRYAIEAFKKEIPRQFHNDGGNFESATGYHQFSLEVVLTAILFIRVFFGDKASQEIVDRVLGYGVREKLWSALDLVRDYMACYGQSPHIGDSSDCRVLITKDYFNRRTSDHSFLFEMGKVAIGYEKPDQREGIARVYPESGYGCFRNDHYGIVAFAGPKGSEGRGGHGHNDKCSFVLQVRDCPILVDSGTYIYNPNIKARYAMKQGKAHNIVMIDGMEQAEIDPELVFGIRGKIQSKIEMQKEDCKPRFRMGHDGYGRFLYLGWVLRDISCYDGRIVLKDTIDGSGEHEVTMCFRIHPDVIIKKINTSVVLSTGKGLITLIFPESFFVRLEDSYYSNAYHSMTKNNRIIAKSKLKLPVSWMTEVHIE